MLNKLKRTPIIFGCDPEFFFGKEGEIIGAEKIIPKDGLKTSAGKIIIDGIQAELNPSPSFCREIMASNISACFNELYANIKKDKKLVTNFEQTVKISSKEMDSLSASSKTFGCSPSFNAQDKKAKIGIKDASKYMFRSAGGHLHIGTTSVNNVKKQKHLEKIFKKEPERLIKMMDIIVGNTCVLLDRSEGNKERRKVYGRAGEYRLPAHGVEYRTLSNFWLKNYALMSFVMSLARFAISIVIESEKKSNFEKEILSKVNMKDIAKAINTNDFVLAQQNFSKIQPIIEEMIDESTYQDAPLTKRNLPLFEHFVKKGINYWFNEEPIKHWLSIGNGIRWGWERFVIEKIKLDKLKESIN